MISILQDEQLNYLQKKLRDSLYAQLRLSLQGGTTAPQGTQAYNIIKQQRVSIVKDLISFFFVSKMSEKFLLSM